MDLRETYNKIAELWHADHGRDTWWTEATDKFISLVKPGGFVLDAGCGAGVKSKYLAQHGLQVFGIDFSEKMIELARREVPQASFETHDIRELPSLKKNFDGIFMQAVLLHISKTEVQTIINDAASLLKTSGPLYIAVKEHRQGQPEEEMKTENDYGFEYTRFFSYFTLDEIQGYLQNCGLKIVYTGIRPSGHTNWINVIGIKE